MDKIYNFEQYQGLNLDDSLIVNSTLDIKHGSILCINNEDADKLDYLINQALKKDVDKILTSSKSKISSEKVFRFGDYEKVFDDVLYNIYPSYKNKTYFGVTGTNGKTTTSLLIHKILKDAGFDVLLAGNVGNSFSYEISKKDYELIVLEVSSFQLDNIVSFCPYISILLNITPDHLDRYNENFDEYLHSKLKITSNQKQNDFLIYNHDDPGFKKINTNAKKIPLSLNKEILSDGGYYKNNQININLNNKAMTIEKLALNGTHNIFNSMAAAMAARVFDVSDDMIRKSLIDFENIEHRLEYVITVHGIDFINYSKATNVNAAWYAVESMNKPFVWILGGVDKGNDYTELIKVAKEKKIKAIICLGDENKKIKESFKSVVDIIEEAKDMHEAVNKSYAIASSGDVVLLSPACASFDLFENFEHRGSEFKKMVRSL